MTKPTPCPGIMQIQPYVGGEASAEATRLIRLASNEGAFGASPRAIDAYREVAGELHRYPDGGSLALRHAIGARFGLEPDRMVCGAGSDELISLLINAYAGPGDEVIHSAHGFLMYPISTMAAGAKPVSAPETDLRADVDAILDAVTERTRMVFLANPNNPTGSHLSPAEIARLHAGLRPDIVFVIDAAYSDYIDGEDYAPGFDLAETAENVVVTQTFSKIHGLAALRLGWLYASAAIVDVLNRVRGPFNVNLPAQAAGVAAIQDIDFVAKSRVHNVQARARTADALTAMGLTVYPSLGNFLLVDFDTAERADSVRLALKSEGILVRQMGAYQLPSCLRISIGTDAEMEETTEVLRAKLELVAA